MLDLHAQGDAKESRLCLAMQKERDKYETLRSVGDEQKCQIERLNYDFTACTEATAVAMQQEREEHVAALACAQENNAAQHILATMQQCRKQKHNKRMRI